VKARTNAKGWPADPAATSQIPSRSHPHPVAAVRARSARAGRLCAQGRCRGTRVAAQTAVHSLRSQYAARSLVHGCRWTRPPAGEICPPRRHSRRRRIGSSRRSRATLHYYAPSPPASARRTTVEPDRGLHLSARALRVSLMQQLRRRDACRRHTGQGARTRT
jgi:hypothetical protein